MQAVVLVDVGRLELLPVPCPAPRPDEVRVRVAAVGLCGTDLHIVAGHANYNRDLRGRVLPLPEAPQILGHEITGVVDEVGALVTDVRRGDRVVVDQGRNCVSEQRSPLCEYCATGHSHQCERYAEHGITGLPGGFAEYITVPAVNTVRIESDIEPAVAALAEPLGCVLHACETLARTPSRFTLASRESARSVRAVVIIGAGPAGLLFVQYLRGVLGFDGLILVSEPNARRRALAQRFGAESIDTSSLDVADAVRERTGGRGVELLIEASGSGQAFATIPACIRKQGTVMLYGHGHAGVDLSVLNGIQFMEPALLTPAGASGGFEPDRRPTTYVQALGLIESGRVDVAPLITHRYDSLAAVPRAFAGDHRSADYVKGVVVL
jgi:L-iditol 2-dehydrogenase